MVGRAETMDEMPVRRMVPQSPSPMSVSVNVICGSLLVILDWMEKIMAVMRLASPVAIDKYFKP